MCVPEIRQGCRVKQRWVILIILTLIRHEEISSDGIKIAQEKLPSIKDASLEKTCVVWCVVSA
jgi:hypothetical protein